MTQRKLMQRSLKTALILFRYIQPCHLDDKYVRKQLKFQSILNLFSIYFITLSVFENLELYCLNVWVFFSPFKTFNRM